jgi:hypothetical protein
VLRVSVCYRDAERAVRVFDEASPLPVAGRKRERRGGIVARRRWASEHPEEYREIPPPKRRTDGDGGADAVRAASLAS